MLATTSSVSILVQRLSARANLLPSCSRPSMTASALQASSSMFEAFGEVDLKHAKFVKKEYESLNELAGKWFAKTSVRLSPSCTEARADQLAICHRKRKRPSTNLSLSSTTRCRKRRRPTRRLGHERRNRQWWTLRPLPLRTTATSNLCRSSPTRFRVSSSATPSRQARNGTASSRRSAARCVVSPRRVGGTGWRAPRRGERGSVA